MLELRNTANGMQIKLQHRNAENAAMDIYIYIIYVSLVGGLEHEFYFP